MSLEKQRTPFKLVVRWDDAGVLNRASMNYMTRVTEDGVTVSESMEEVPITDLGQQLGDVFTQLNVEVLDEVEKLRARLAEVEPAYAKACRDLDAHVAECEGLKVERDKLLTEKSNTDAAARERARVLLRKAR